MRKHLLAALLGLAAIATLPAPAYALTEAANFNVSVTLTPKCTFSGSISDLQLTYTSLQGSASSNTTPFTFKCTTGIPYTFSFGGTGGASGTLAGLAYTLATFASDGTTAKAGGTGTGADETYTIKGSIASGQAGDCTGTTLAVGSCTAATTTGVHTIVVTY